MSSRAHRHSVDVGHQEHDVLRSADNERERATWMVIALTIAAMIAEIAAGRFFQSMALLADGWHMGSHASALGITAFAYAYGRRHADDARFAFGTWKVGALGGFASAIVLAVVALLLAWESLGRLFEPLAIGFDEAIAVAVVGLIVNLVSAYLLHGSAGTRHDHGGGGSGADSRDHNLRAAYAHVLTDALTSVLAIVALLAGKHVGWVWMDPMMGIVGGAIILRWSVSLVRDTSRILLDGDVDPEIAERVRLAIESHDDNQVVDLHLWRVMPSGLSAIISVATHRPRAPEHYKALIADIFGLTHVTIEVHRCPGENCTV